MAKRNIPTKKTPQAKTKVVARKKIHRKVKLAVVPHADNQYRPYLVRFGGLIAIVVTVVAMQFAYNWLQTGSVLGVEANITSSELLEGLNTERQKNGVKELEYSEQLSAAAYLKAQDMLAKQYWAHNAPDGTTPWQWLGKVNYNYAYAGENLAKNFTSATATTAAWMASPAHRKNMLDERYADIGFAVIDGELQGTSTKLVVAMFGAPMGHVSVAGVHNTAAPVNGDMSPVSQFGVAMQSITPAALGSVVLLLFAAVVALSAQMYRRKLPLAVRRSWRYHHGLYKAAGLSALAIVIVTLYSGGQI